MGQNLTALSKEELRAEEARLAVQYEAFKKRGLKLDMSRGKPGSNQLDLANAALEHFGSVKSESGADARNYGVLEGLPETRRFFGELLNLDPELITIGGNSSLNLMYDALSRCMLFGCLGSTPWCRLPKVKFLCPAPGYDRHFGVTADFGIEMIPVEMHEDGPDMDEVERLVSADDSVKGIWCVPLYSNPQGYCYSDETVSRLGKMKCAAQDFRIFWDNAYGVHHLYGETELADIFAACREGGNPDRVFYFFSTSKITFPGAGVSLIASSAANTAELRSHMGKQTIGHDKLNQLRTIRFLGNAEGVRRQMERQAELIRPKFELCQEILERELGGSGVASWTHPKGGYFISLDACDNCAKEIVRLAKEAGVTMTGAGAAFPYKKDPRDRNIRIAPTYPPLEELKLAIELFTLCVKLAAVRKLLAA